jgi:hypothetical protein
MMQQMVEAMQAAMRFTIREMRLRSNRHDPAASVAGTFFAADGGT